MKIRSLDDKNSYTTIQLSRNFPTTDHLNVNIIHKYLPLDKNGFILDVGCRSGTTVQSLLKNGYVNTYGMDIGDIPWKNFSQDLRTHFIKNDIHNGIPIESKFDLITCSHMFEHSHDPIQLLKIFKDKLSKTGILYVSVPLDYSSRKMDHTPHYTFFESEDDFKKFMESNEFEIIEIYTNNNGPGGFPEVISFSRPKI